MEGHGRWELAGDRTCSDDQPRAMTKLVSHCKHMLVRVASLMFCNSLVFVQPIASTGRRGSGVWRPGGALAAASAIAAAAFAAEALLHTGAQFRAGETKGMEGGRWREIAPAASRAVRPRGVYRGGGAAASNCGRGATSYPRRGESGWRCGSEGR